MKPPYSYIKEISHLMVVIFLIQFMTFCTKSIVDDCDCGPITATWQDNGWSYVQWRDACSGRLTTIEMPFDMSTWHIGDTVCKLNEIDTNEIKP